MIKFILAGALGALSISVILLFRQQRQLRWQLTQIRVDRDSDHIMRALTNRGAASRPLPLLEDRSPRRRSDPYLWLCLLVGAVALGAALLLDTGTGNAAESTTTADRQVAVCH
ncbi:hypothetical protein ACIOHE_39410 [Streptomyces sp. NPDC087851]|uniref:hypothetical protein n=1 Tax=Streptomyces sp. NPDC087851 TaxID=3365810 RepID=UPI00382586B4